MSEAHTPGPWWITDSSVRDSGGAICLSVKPTHYLGQSERYSKEVLEREANMHLIAAAPDLLEASIEMLAAGQFSITSDDSVAAMLRFGAADEGLKAAIAKATGSAA